MSERQLVAGGVMIAALIGAVALRRVAVTQGAILGVGPKEVTIIGIAAAAILAGARRGGGHGHRQ